MVYRRYAKRPYTRRPYKKYGKKYNRRRFTKKRYAKNSVNQLTMRAPLAARLLRVKLPWVKVIDDTVAISDNESYAFQGNGIVPFTSLGQLSTGTGNVPSPGDSLPAGEVEYSSLYDKYFINGSSITVEAVMTSTASTTQAMLRAVLIAVPFTQGDPTDDWHAVKNQLDAYDYEELLAWPYAKWRMIAANTGGVPRLKFKMFRKTKSMCGVKDLRDNAIYGAQLTDGSSSYTNQPQINPNSGFMYYLRFFNASDVNATPLHITVRMSLYCTLTNREFNPIQTITD